MKRSFRSILAVITVAATLLPIVNIIEADEASVETASQVVNLFDAVAKYPVPSWFKPGNYFEQFEPYKEQKGATFILGQIPKGESFDKWSKLFAVLAYQSSNLTMEKLVNVMLNPIYQMCGKAHFSSKPVDRTPDGDTYIVTCQKTPNGRDKLDYG
ncbi:hypothetical protein OAA86_07080 [Rhodospirillales bacterium]|nr:hypothetical protein [Rhodospirillales bacterium]